MNLDCARAVADAVLLEGYCLYPYRASAPKNQNPYRWQFGVLAPRSWSEGGGCEPWWLEAQCLVHRAECVEGSLRFLRRVSRQVQRATGPDSYASTDALEVGDQLWVTWDEADVEEVPLAIAVRNGPAETDVPFELASTTEVDLIRDGERVVGRVVRKRSTVSGSVRVRVEPAAGADLVRLSLRVECTTPWADVFATRQDALAGSCLSTHLLLGTRDGAFLSLQDPPNWAAEASRSCKSVRSYPVLAGPAGASDILLCAPIILYDHAAISPESPGDFFDASEIDELLTLRTATLTPDEKRQVRATDARAAAILDRVDQMPPEVMERLHGVLRDMGSGPVPRFGPGVRVVLRPGRRRTDAQDLLYAGMTATIEKVMEDLDGQTCLAVTIDDDPASELHRWYGRFHYYYPDEVEPVV